MQLLLVLQMLPLVVVVVLLLHRRPHDRRRAPGGCHLPAPPRLPRPLLLLLLHMSHALPKLRVCIHRCLRPREVIASVVTGLAQGNMSMACACALVHACFCP